MADSLTIASGLFAVRTTREIAGVRLPWEVEGYQEDARRAEGGGLLDLSHWETVEIAGPDARDYLQRMSTADFRTVAPGTLWRGGFLTGRAQVVAVGMFHTLASDRFHFVVPQGQGGLAHDHVERFHFAERMEVRPVSSEWLWLGIYDPRQQWAPRLGLGEAGSDSAVPAQVWRDDWLPHWLWVKLERSRGGEFLRWFHGHGGALLGLRYFEYLRIRAGVPEVGREITGTELVLEANLDRVVARQKGCYPGQEVVERIHTYGQVNRKLRAVVVEPVPDPAAPPLRLEGDGKEAGYLVSWAPDPFHPERAFGLAYVRRPYWDFSGSFGTEAGARVTLSEFLSQDPQT